MSKPVSTIVGVRGPKSRRVEFGLPALVSQFIEELSDLEMVRHPVENPSAKWFLETGHNKPLQVTVILVIIVPE